MITKEFILKHEEIDIDVFFIAANIHRIIVLEGGNKNENKKIILDNCRGLPAKVLQDVIFILENGYDIGIA